MSAATRGHCFRYEPCGNCHRCTIVDKATSDADAAVLRRLADEFERKADAYAITYQDAVQRRLATSPLRARVVMLRSIADELTRPTSPEEG